MAITFKLPAEVVAVHRTALEAWDWQRAPEAELALLMPDGGFLEGDKLETTVRLGRVVVRAKNIGAVTRMRAYAESLPQLPKPTAEEVSAVLKRRNPESE